MASAHAHDAASVEPIEGSHPSLYNHDLAPVPRARRTWTLWNFAALWVGMVVCVPSYSIAAGMIDQGLNWWQATLLVLLGNGIVLVPILLNAHAGARYGVPFPVLARASFGVFGANVPAMARAVVACGWFGIQSWVGGSALYALYATVAGVTPAAGASAGHFVGFGIFWLINVYFVVRGAEGIKFLETYAAPFLISACVGLLLWAVTHTQGLSAMLAATTPRRPASFSALFWPNLTAMVGFWATLAINIPDFTRYARSQRDQVIGQAIALPTAMSAVAFIGVAVTGATMLLYGRALWNPTDLIPRLGSPFVVALSTFALSLATLSTNMAANVVGPANDFANLAPGKISYRLGGLITALIGVLMMPWKLLESSASYTFTWLVGYSALLGPVSGIMIADYFVLRGTRLEVDELYRAEGGYRYNRGVNPRALVALVLGVLPSIPGFLRALAKARGQVLVPSFSDQIYEAAWFVGFFFAGAVYVAAMKLAPPAKAAPRA